DSLLRRCGAVDYWTWSVHGARQGASTMSSIRRFAAIVASATGLIVALLFLSATSALAAAPGISVDVSAGVNVNVGGVGVSVGTGGTASTGVSAGNAPAGNAGGGAQAS